MLNYWPMKATNGALRGRVSLRDGTAELTLVETTDVFCYWLGANFTAPLRPDVPCSLPKEAYAVMALRDGAIYAYARLTDDAPPPAALRARLLARSEPRPTVAVPLGKRTAATASSQEPTEAVPASVRASAPTVPARAAVPTEAPPLSAKVSVPTAAVSASAPIKPVPASAAVPTEAIPQEEEPSRVCCFDENTMQKQPCPCEIAPQEPTCSCDNAPQEPTCPCENDTQEPTCPCENAPWEPTCSCDNAPQEATCSCDNDPQEPTCSFAESDAPSDGNEKAAKEAAPNPQAKGEGEADNEEEGADDQEETFSDDVSATAAQTASFSELLRRAGALFDELETQ